MTTPLIPPPSTRQEAWDTAARLASQGVELPTIVSKVLYAASPRIDQEAVKAVPARGRTFWVTMATAMAWVLAVYVTFLVFESAGTHAIPALKLAIYLGVAVWAIGFGILASNHKVRERRSRVGTAKRAALERLAQDAAQHVWASEVPGDWKPLGPAPTWATADADLAAAWLRRFGAGPGDVAGLLVDGSPAALHGALRLHPAIPVVLFVRDPGTFADESRELAESVGAALFVVARQGLLPMSPVASAALDAYRRPGSGSPAEVLGRARLRASAAGR